MTKTQIALLCLDQRKKNLVNVFESDYGIFEIEYSWMVRQYNTYSPFEKYVLRAIHSVHDMIEDPRKIASIGIKSAIQFNQKTSYSYSLYRLANR